MRRNVKTRGRSQGLMLIIHPGMVGGAVNEAIHVEERLMLLKWNEKQIHRYEFINNHTVLSVADFIYFDRYAVILSKLSRKRTRNYRITAGIVDTPLTEICQLQSLHHVHVNCVVPCIGNELIDTYRCKGKKQRNEDSVDIQVSALIVVTVDWNAPLLNDAWVPRTVGISM